jgi:hypothetical protein
VSPRCGSPEFEVLSSEFSPSVPRRGTEVVVTGAPRKRLVAKSGTWVRIPPSPPAFAAFGGFGWASPVILEPEASTELAQPKRGEGCPAEAAKPRRRTTFLFHSSLCACSQLLRHPGIDRAPVAVVGHSSVAVSLQCRGAWRGSRRESSFFAATGILNATPQA